MSGGSGSSIFLFAPGFLCALILALSPLAAQAQDAGFQGGAMTLAQGEDVTFPIVTDNQSPADFHTRCTLEGGDGPAMLTFDAERYIPLSEPQVGQRITLGAHEQRLYELSGTIEPGQVDAYISFAFAGAPEALCLPGMDCGKAAKGASSVKVACTSR
ncbi:MAG: hypothetical protein PW790_09200 [Parvibaculaceae bacterium]|nr:hypothetical protein [Parvibaculaceae bacterium]